MPLNKLLLILAIVIVAAGVTVWVGALLSTQFAPSSLGWGVLLPVVLIAYLLWRVLAGRPGGPTGVRHDKDVE